MISSRSKGNFRGGSDGQPLPEIRKELKKEIENLKVLGRQMFEVWINEEPPPQGGSWDSWDTCLKSVRDCDILIALSNGYAGRAEDGGEIGICHAELMAGLAHAPAKVRVIGLGSIPIDKTIEGNRNALFQKYLSTQSLFRGSEVKTVKELKDRVKDAVYEALISLVQAGECESSRGHYDPAEALNWRLLDFEAREQAMLKILQDEIGQHSGSKREGINRIVSLGDTDVLLVPHAVPTAFSIGSAKEMVGQPFLRDHELDGVLTKDCGGPLHLIACHKNTTESQAIKLLGFLDATVMPTPFGVFVADNIQKVQIAFIVSCRDEASTRHGVQRFFLWLAQSGEEAYIAKRAKARARIVHTIAKELNTKPGIPVRKNSIEVGIAES
jgi:hypothetical protein